MGKFLLAVLVLTFVGAHATSDIVVKVEEEELSPLLRTFCCGPYTCSSVTNACQQLLMPPQLQQLMPPQLQLLMPPQLQLLMLPQLQLLMPLQLQQLMPPQL